MLPSYDLFMFGITRPDSTLSSVSIGMAKEWSKTNRVFYFDRPYSFKDLPEVWNLPSFAERKKSFLKPTNVYKELKGKDYSFIQVTPRLSLPLNFLPEGKLYHFLNRYNNFLVLESMKEVIRDFQVKDYLYFNSFLPVQVPFIPKDFPLPTLASVYQSNDEMSEEPYIARHGVAAEAVAIKNCDIPIGTSTRLCERHAAASGRKVHLVANGADFSTFERALFKDLQKPEAMIGFDKPVIIYTGHYSDLRLDHDLVIRITKEFPEHEVVFVGTYVKEDVERFGLNQIPNLHFLGSQPIEALPAYLRHSKVAIIPYKCNNLTSGIYPLKVNEFLAAGIPCVSSNFSKDIAAFSDVIYLADTHEEFIEGIKKGLAENPSKQLERRLACAQSNSWRKRIEELEALVELKLAGKLD